MKNTLQVIPINVINVAFSITSNEIIIKNIDLILNTIIIILFTIRDTSIKVSKFIIVSLNIIISTTLNALMDAIPNTNNLVTTTTLKVSRNMVPSFSNLALYIIQNITTIPLMLYMITTMHI